MTDYEGIDRNPLTVPLAEEQVDLLTAVWEPISKPEIHGEQVWPTWDFASRRFYEMRPNVVDAAAVLNSLPQLSHGAWAEGQPYGLVWQSGVRAVGPTLGDQVGLTIAGLAQLARHSRVNPAVVDGLTHVINHLAEQEAGLQAKPSAVAARNVDLDRFVRGFGNPTPDRTYAIPVKVIAQLLSHEYAPIAVIRADADSGQQVTVGQLSLRQWRQMAAATDYIARIGDHHRSSIPPARLRSPLTLIQTLDYLGYVLAEDPGWPRKDRRFATAPDLQSAAALAATVSTREEFETALHGLWNVIDELAVPDIPEAKGTVNKLDHWLNARLAQTEAADRVAAAILVIRAVRHLRVESAHPSPTTRDKAIQIRRTLFLPDVLSDWPHAWSDIQSHLAGAFDVIRQAIQTSGAGGAG